ncbi:enoyl-CoA hydratase/carnithine racemase [Microbacterium sp. AK009]|uniref:enoyl-CoA hydratase/isomerase family protein n=1 Tax=Microbacterium sp. AK009 TaxID=2723068 RepID=UPI0015CDB6C3|nr:enoyl-CoA hydratase/isomerase family protein [Microbacterium sp. AK009]NYF16547.1 enoyl-CoA hydratase/carnithine racemase [Microbacterium sp. AK009]
MTDHATGNVRLERDGHLAHVVIDRPAKLNAMTVAMDHQMNDLIFEINNNPDIRVVVLRGTGDRAFSAGSDLTDLDEYGDNWSYRNRFDNRSDYARAVWLLRKPAIAAVHGYCIGGGLEMASGCDIRIASRDASFGAGEIRWGWHGGSGQTQFLTRLVGPGHAAKLLLTGDRIDASEAYRIGLVQELVDREQLVDRAVELAQSIAEKSPIATQRTKYMVRVAQNVGLDAALLVENDSFSYLMLTEDAKEGQTAFAEKRQPIFKGR